MVCHLIEIFIPGEMIFMPLCSPFSVALHVDPPLISNENSGTMLRSKDAQHEQLKMLLKNERPTKWNTLRLHEND